MPNRLSILTAATALAAAGSVALAQSGGVVYAPIDQVADDLDPSARPMRHMDPGLRYDGEHTSLFEMIRTDGEPLDPITQYRFIRIAPGFRVRMNQMDYLVLLNPSPGKRLKVGDFGYNVKPAIDGAFIEMPPAGMVYDLRPLNLDVKRSRPRFYRKNEDDLSIAFLQTFHEDRRMDADSVQPIAYEIEQHDVHDVNQRNAEGAGQGANSKNEVDKEWLRIDPGLDINTEEVPYLKALELVRQQQRTRETRDLAAESRPTNDVSEVESTTSDNQEPPAGKEVENPEAGSSTAD